MADLSKTVEIIFKGDDRLSSAVTGIESNFDSLTGKLSDVAAPLASTAEAVLKVEGALAALAIGGMALAIKAAGDFGGQFSEITTLLDDVGTPIDTFRNDVLEYSKDSVKSIEEINGAVYAAISAGVDYKDSIDFVTEAEKLSVAGKGDLNSTTVALVSTLNAYGASTDEAGRYSDILFQTVRAGQTTLPELATSLSQVTSIAGAAGIPFETLSAAIATLTAKGMPTAEAITAIKGTLTAIISPSTEAATAAEQLGIDFSATALKSKGLEGVLQEVMTATHGNIEEVSSLFGNVRGLSGVLGLASDDSALFSANLLKMKESSGVVNEAYEKMADDIKLINQNLANNFRATLVQIGDNLLPTYSDIAGNVAGIFSGIGDAVQSGAFDPIFDLINDFGDRVSTILGNIKENLPEALEGIDYTDLIASLKKLGGAVSDAFESVFGEMDLTTVEGLETAIQKGVDALAALQNVVTGVIKGMDPLFKALGFGIEHFSEMGDKAAETAGKILGWGKTASVVLEYSGIFKTFIGLLSGSIMINAVANIVSMGKALISMGGTLGVIGAAGGPLVVLTAAITAITGAWKYSTLAAQDEDNALTTVSTSIFGLIDKYGLLTGVTDEDRKAREAANVAFEEAKKKAAALNSELENVPGKKTTELEAFGYEDALKMVKEAMGTIEEVPDKKTTELAVEGDPDEAERVGNLLIERLPNEEIIITKVEPDDDSIEETKKKIDEEIPGQKELEIQTKLDIERIKAMSDIVQESIKWKAEIDIAEIEAGTERIKTAFESVNVGIESTGEVLGDIFAVLGDAEDRRVQLDMFDLADREMVLREKEFAAQQKLINAQVKMMQSKTEALERGDAMISIDGSGLQPHLEAFMWEVLGAIQVRANAEGSEFLLGI